MSRLIIYLLLNFLFIPVWAEVRLPRLFSDNMVIQREKTIKVWGWADKGEVVTVELNGQIAEKKASKDGQWMVTLLPMQHGGPYTLTVKGKKNIIKLENILIGDVWLCSGQSNMEMKLSAARNADEEIKNADYPMIRAFNVPREYSYTQQGDVAGGEWLVCEPVNAGKFTAVGYFYARKIYQETGIPIGILNSSWGGTLIESWTGLASFNKLPAPFIEKYSKTSQLVAPASYFAETEKSKALYIKAMEADSGVAQKWYLPSTPTKAWKTAKVPQSWNLNELAAIDGIVWFRHEFQLSAKSDAKIGLISLGTIGDEDEVWINGIKVGSTDYKFAKRNYFVSPDILRSGTNTIVVKITDNGLDGGINGSVKDIFLQTDSETVSLCGTWLYRISVSSKDYNYTKIWRNSYPSLTYNSMLHPLVNYSIKGVLWYQGEQNTGHDAQYKALLPNLISSWRGDWGYDFPFHVIQLPNFKQPDRQPPLRSVWASLREAQMAALELSYTSVTVTTDLGLANDIHPTNKQDVGLRAALHALFQTYGQKNTVADGPMYRSFEVKGNQIVISFHESPSMLKSNDKYGYIKGFAIAGSDKKFVWAKAYITGNRIAVSAAGVDKPVAVRYNWADNPDGSLYNEDDLPAYPFRTDDW